MTRPPTVPGWDLNPGPLSCEASALLTALKRPDINRIHEILRRVAGIKSILWILAILRGVYGVMGTVSRLHLNLGTQVRIPVGA